MSRNRNLAVNRQAYFNYEVLEKYEAGSILTGTEIKSIRLGRVDLRGSYVRAEKNELWQSQEISIQSTKIAVNA